MTNVFFNPNVGKNYELEGYNGLKLLILGESHYCGEDCEDCGKESQSECSNFTLNVLNSYLNYKRGSGEHERWMNTFTRFTNILLGEQVNNETLINFWNAVIFYNYVQSSTNGPRIAPTPKQFEDSKDGFIKILKKYKPDLILVWGERLWNNLPNTGRWGEENILDNANGRFYYYNINNKEIPAYSIYHPSSSSFSYEYSKHLKESINLVSEQLKLNMQ